MRLEFDIETLRPLIAEIIGELQAAFGSTQQPRLGYTETEVAELLGLPKHVVRDCRLRGEIAAKKVGKSYIYAASELQRLLAAGEVAR